MNVKPVVSWISLWVGLTSIVSTAAAPTLRIWPVGDSITEGCCLDIGGGYRTELFKQLTTAGYNVDDVGTLVDLHPPPDLPDIDHEGHDGWRIDEIDAGIESWASATDDPDVILLHIGTNDFAQNHDTTNAIHRLEGLVAHLAALHPYARIIVANLIVAADPAINNAEQNSYNAFIPGVVAHQVSLGRKVSFVDMHSCCGVSDLSDQVHGLHPTTSGYAKMAGKWFSAITSLITPLGTSDAPGILRLFGQLDLKRVVVTFSKPVEDAAADVSHFSLSGGLSISQGVLDSSRRMITLTTTPQTPGTTYTLTVDGVRDRTTPSHAIASGTTAVFQSSPVAEAANYSLVYSLRLPDQANYNATGVNYEVDNHASIGPFRRVAYYLQLEPVGRAAQYLWVSMDPFTSDIRKIGVPTLQSGAFFQQRVANMNVRSSVPGVITGDGLTGGNIEFWWGNYTKVNAAAVPGASDARYDFGDSASASSGAGY